MPYALVEVELLGPPPPVQLGAADHGVALVSRRAGQVVGFAMHELAPGTSLTPNEVGAMLDPDPVGADGPDDRRVAMRHPSITVAVCTRGRPDLLASCLRSLLDGGTAPDDILVVDNAPTDHRTRAAVLAAGARYEVEPCPGLDLARNRALRTADSDVVAFVDDDVVVDRHWRDRLGAVWASSPAAGAVTGQILPLELATAAQVAFERRGGFRGGNRRVRYSGQDLDGNPTYPYSPGMFGAGANLSVRRATVLRLGGFDEALDTGPPLPGGGDIDVMQRIIRAGAELMYEPTVVVFHRHRRDVAGLRRQYDSWGRSSMAVVAKTYRSDPGGRPKLRRYVRWFFRTQARAAWRDLFGPRSDEGHAARAELVGGVAGLAGTYGRSRRRMSRLRRSAGRPTVAILPWGHVVEDYLDPIGLTLDEFADHQAGGWLFGFAEAYRRAGVDTVIVCWSKRVGLPTRRTHLPTGSTLWLLPAARSYRAARAQLVDPYAWGWRAATGDHEGAAPTGIAAYEAAPYLATTVVGLARILRREGCRAVLCQEYEEARFDVCIGVGRLLRLPVFATFQGGDHTRTRLERLVRRRTVRAAAGLVIGAEGEAERVRRHYAVAAGRIAAIPNPLDPSTVPVVGRADARAALGIDASTRVVAWHGRVDVHPKGIDVLVEAWCELRRSAGGPELLLLLGTGSGAGWLHQRIDELGLDDVRWRDEYVLDRYAIGTHLSAADVYVLPSRQEGFPVAPVEAMAAGLPVVASDAPGVQAVVGTGDDTGGTVVPVDDPHALAVALRRYLDDADLTARTGRAAARRVEARFSLDGVGAQLRAFTVDR